MAKCELSSDRQKTRRYILRKIIIYMLVALMLLSTLVAFAGCDQSKQPEDDGSDDGNLGAEDYDFPDVERKSYDDSFELYIAGANGGKKRWYMDSDLNSGSAMDEAVFARQERVRKYLGVEFAAVENPNAAYNTYQTDIQAAVQNKDGTIDALITHVHGGVSNLISDGLLTDFGELEGVDLYADYWHKEFMDSLELNGNYFLGHSDYNILKTAVIAYNKDLLAQYGSTMDKSVYDMVRNYQWTLDEMAKLTKLVSIDVTGDGKTKDDYFGFTGLTHIYFNGFLTSSNIPMVAQTSSGAYEVALSKPEYYAKTDSLVQFFRELDDSQYTYFSHSIHVGSEVELSSGRTLMQVIYTDQLEGLLSYDIEFGVLPFPLYDTDQKSVGYKSLQWGGYLGVLSYTKNPLLVGETLEMLAYYSENVKITYYEKVLGKRIADMPDDAEMLEIIWQSVATDVGQTFCNLGPSGDESGVCYTIPNLMGNRKNNLSSYLQGKEKSINAAFKKFLETIGD